MFKFVVLCALVAAAAAKPSGALAYASYAAPLQVAAPAVAVPAAVSHSYRTDVISKPIVATFAHQPAVVAAPIVERTAVVAAPAQVVAPAPIVRSAVVAAPAPLLHHRAAVAVAAPAPLLHQRAAILPAAHGLAYAAPHAYGYAAHHGFGYGLY